MKYGEKAHNGGFVIDRCAFYCYNKTRKEVVL